MCWRSGAPSRCRQRRGRRTPRWRPGWPSASHRQGGCWVTLAMLAYAFLVVAAVIQHGQHPAPPGATQLTCNEIHHLFATLVVVATPPASPCPCPCLPLPTASRSAAMKITIFGWSTNHETEWQERELESTLVLWLQFTHEGSGSHPIRPAGRGPGRGSREAGARGRRGGRQRRHLLRGRRPGVRVQREQVRRAR